MNRLDFKKNPEAFEIASFTIPTDVGPVSFDLAIPKDRYDGFMLFEMFQKHHGPSVEQIKVSSPSKAEEALALLNAARGKSTTATRKRR